MTKVILSKSRGEGNPPAYFVIDRRVPAMQVPAFYVTPREFATVMSLEEAERRIAHNQELRALVGTGLVTVEVLE